jgi:aminopeptidase N
MYIATYAEWLWAEHEFGVTPAQIFQDIYDGIPADSPFWTVVIGDPGVDLLFDGAVYVRGAMTLQALRTEVGDAAFWTIMRGWASSKSGGNGTTPEFIALAEQVSGEQLDALFNSWLFTPAKPALTSTLTMSRTAQHAAAWLQDVQRRLPQGRY